MRLDFKCSGNFNDINDTQISFAAFNGTDIVNMQACAYRKFFLRPIKFMPKASDIIADNNANVHDANFDNSH